VQFGQIAAEARPRQHRADDDVPQRVADEAVGSKKRQNTFRAMNLTSDTARHVIIVDSVSEELVPAGAIQRFKIQHW